MATPVSVATVVRVLFDPVMAYFIDLFLHVVKPRFFDLRLRFLTVTEKNAQFIAELIEVSTASLEYSRTVGGYRGSRATDARLPGIHGARCALDERLD